MLPKQSFKKIDLYKINKYLFVRAENEVAIEFKQTGVRLHLKS